MKQLLREPGLHFFLLGAVLFAAHRLVVGEPRLVVVTPGLGAELGRHFREQMSRPPTAAERAALLEGWKQEEALFREALREHLERDDPTVRNALIERMRARAALEAPRRVPSEGELGAWLAGHRASYERPLRYALAWVPFAKEQPQAARERERVGRSLDAGAEARSLGHPVYGANLTADEIRARFGARLAEEIPRFTNGAWERSETGQDLLLVRVSAVEGGLPPEAELHPRLVTDWTAAMQKEDAARALDAIVRRYRFEERPAAP